MKRVYAFYLLVISILILNCGEKPLEPQHYRIKGIITGLNNGKIYLINSKKIDTVNVINSTFIIESKLKESVSEIQLYKSIDSEEEEDLDSKISASFYIEPANMRLNLDYTNFSNSKLTGSKTQDDQYRFKKISDKIAAKYKKEQDELDRSNQNYKSANLTEISKDELEVIKYENEKARNNLAPMWKEQGEAMLKFIKSNPQSYISMKFLAYQLRDLKYQKAKLIFEKFKQDYKNSKFGQMLLKEIESMNIGIPGTLAAKFNTIDLHGNSLSLSDFDGKYVLIDFWASWCTPCRKGNPHLINLYKKYHSKGMELISISDDDRDPDAWRNAIKKDGIGIWHHALRGLEIDIKTRKKLNPQKDIFASYNISSLPTKILINPKGVIIGRYGISNGNDEDMDRDLAALFN